MRGKEAVGGKVRINGEIIHFDSHGANIQTGETEINIDDITGFKRFKSAGVVNNGLNIIAAGEDHRFVLSDREDVIELVKDIHAYRNREAEPVKEEKPSEEPESGEETKESDDDMTF